MVLKLPPLDSKFETALKLVATELHVSPEKWRESLYPGIRARLKEIKNTAVKHGEAYSKGIDLKALIATSNEDVLRSLHDQFDVNPPFTVVRIAELLCDPPSNGYDLQSNASILKFYNSLTKLVGVCSHMNGKIRTSGSDEKMAILVEIPWLKSEAAKGDNNGKNDDRIIVESKTKPATVSQERNVTPLDEGIKASKDESSGPPHGFADLLNDDDDTESTTSADTNDSAEENSSSSTGVDRSGLEKALNSGSDLGHLSASLPELDLVSLKLARKLDTRGSIPKKLKMQKVSRMDEETLVR